MGRLRRFESHRFVGTRDDMVVYDTDDLHQSERLRDRIEIDRLLDANLLQTFSPDDVTEARNRGFRPLTGDRLS